MFFFSWISGFLRDPPSSRLRYVRALFVLVFVVACDAGRAPSSATTGGTNGGGGNGGGGFVPSAHPAMPRVVNIGGPVYATPLLVPIFYDGDPDKSELESFFSTLSMSDYWSNAVSEYHVGILSVANSQTLAGPAAKTIPDSALHAAITANLNGLSPAWGALDPNGIYVFVIPPGSIVTTPDNETCCQDFDGYHDEATLDGTPTGTPVAYAVVCNCPNFDGPSVTGLDQMTVALSHEIIEAATDPLVESNPAYYQTDPQHGDCTAITGGEVADMCEFNLGAYVEPAGFTHQVQQIYSDAAALAGTDPCLPTNAIAPYFNSIGVFPDTANIGSGYGPSESVNIAVGDSRTIDVQLFSTAPTTGPWQVQAFDYNDYILGNAAELSFAWNQTVGVNGDTLHLTIRVVSADPLGAELFLIQSSLGAQNNLSYGAVGPP